MAARIVELEHTVTALLAENRRLRREVLELQHELDPDAVALDAFDREVGSRIDDARERGGRSSPSPGSTRKEKLMNRELLERPFDPAQIRQRKGRNGVLDCVEGGSQRHRAPQRGAERRMLFRFRAHQAAPRSSVIGAIRYRDRPAAVFWGWGNRERPSGLTHKQLFLCELLVRP